MTSVGCDVERVKERKEARTLCRQEGAVKKNVIKITDRRNVRKGTERRVVKDNLKECEGSKEWPKQNFNFKA